METSFRLKPDLSIVGRTIFILECADGSYYSGMCEDINEELRLINKKSREYFRRNAGKLPVKIVYREDHLPFREAYAKHRYLRFMTRRYRVRLIETGKWPGGSFLKKLLARTCDPVVE